MNEYPDIKDKEDLEAFARIVAQERGRDILEINDLKRKYQTAYKSFGTITTGDIGANITALIDGTTADRTPSLPAASAVKGQVFNLKRIDSSTHTVVVDSSSGNIDNSSTLSLSALGSAIVQSDGSNFWIIG
jgi:hypothetical protein